MKTWIFFKLRMLQLKSDKTSLFFSYVFPVLLLLGIGYPLQLSQDPKIEVYYSDELQDENSKAFLSKIRDHKLIKLKVFDEKDLTPMEAIRANEIALYLLIHASQKTSLDIPSDKLSNSIFAVYKNIDGAEGRNISLHVVKNNIDENRIENRAFMGILDRIYTGNEDLSVNQYTMSSDRLTSYLVTLLPGLIGLTLMIIGFNGFGGVLIEEENFGLFKNIKTIDVSPIAFLNGLFLSRLLVSYTVAAALCLISIFVFNIKFEFNFILLALVVTLGSVSFLGIGLAIATLAPSTSAFNGIVNFVQMPFIVLGGVFFSITLFPDWVQMISMLIPLTHMITAMQKVLFDSMLLSNIGDIGLELSVMSAWCVGSLVLAKLKFNW